MELYASGMLRLLPLLLFGTLPIMMTIPYMPALTTDFFAHRAWRAAGSPSLPPPPGQPEPLAPLFPCEAYGHGREPEPCVNAHSTAVLYSSYTSFVANRYAATEQPSLPLPLYLVLSSTYPSFSLSPSLPFSFSPPPPSHTH